MLCFILVAHGRLFIVVGETFSSYTDLQAKIKVYEAKNSVQLFCRDSRTLNAASRRVPKQVDEATGEHEKLLNSQVCEWYKLYSCVIGIGKTALPFTNEHNSESSDSINGNISLKITGKLIYNVRWVSWSAGQTQEVNRQMLLSDCVVDDINSTRASEKNVYILLIFYWMWLDITVSKIKLPPKIKKIGIPKGAELTVIGLPKKKQKEAD